MGCRTNSVGGLVVYFSFEINFYSLIVAASCLIKTLYWSERQHQSSAKYVTCIFKVKLQQNSSCFPLHLISTFLSWLFYLRPVVLSSSFPSPPREYQHFLIQQGSTGTLWNHLFHGSLIECDTSRTSNDRSSDSFSPRASLQFGLSVLFLAFCTHKQKQSQNAQAQKKDVYSAGHLTQWPPLVEVLAAVM